MNFMKVAQTNDIASGDMKKVTDAGHDILIANIGGKFHAIPSTCTHMSEDLSKGTLQDCIVTCPKHGSKFDVRTGQAVGEARVLFFKMKVKNTHSYPVKVEGDDILVGLD